ncbi:unnamed protein product, partial [Choristocarpus tenellus]
MCTELASWIVIAGYLKQRFPVNPRSAKQCCERLYHHLDPEVSKNEWTADE